MPNSTQHTDLNQLDKELEELFFEQERNENLLHYVSKSRPLENALCGMEPPAKGWWADIATEAEAIAQKWEICPACQVRYSDLGRFWN